MVTRVFASREYGLDGLDSPDCMTASVEQYIGECLVKCGSCILAARIHSPTGAGAQDRRNARWFLLELEEVQGAAQCLDGSRRDIGSPLILEVAVRLPANLLAAADSAAASDTRPVELVVERWTLHLSPSMQSGASLLATSSSSGSSGQPLTGSYPRSASLAWSASGQSREGSSSGSGSGGNAGVGSSRSYTDAASVYKRLTLLVRALHSHLRVLPAFRLYRAAKRCQGCGLSGLMVYSVVRGGRLLGGTSSRCLAAAAAAAAGGAAAGGAAVAGAAAGGGAAAAAAGGGGGAAAAAAGGGGGVAAPAVLATGAATSSTAGGGARWAACLRRGRQQQQQQQRRTSYAAALPVCVCTGGDRGGQLQGAGGVCACSHTAGFGARHRTPHPHCPPAHHL
ncbi:hypothetical protein V8C86DRAFT_1285802 [Haematococcus lacustris]